MIVFDTEDGFRFAHQNEDYIAGLTDGELNLIDQYAEHHAGNLYVLLRWLGENVYVKTHESWDGPHEGKPFVVHVYDSEEPHRDRVTFYATGSEALKAFMRAEESLPLERSYLVGLPVVITVTDEGRVRYEVDTSEAAQAVGEEYDVPESVIDAIDADHDRRHGR